MPQIQIFDWNTRPVRSVMLDGEPALVASDLCFILGIKNTSQSLDNIPEAWKGICETYTPNGVQKVLALKEPGIYRLIFRSNKPNAVAFQEWVFGVVLPSLRKEGTYGVPKPEPEQHHDLAHKKEAFSTCLEIAKLMGLEGNQALLTANKGFKSNMGCDLLAEFQIALPSPNNEALLTPTEIGRKFGRSAQQVNLRLSGMKLQVREGSQWRLTEAGKKFGVLLDVNKAHGNGTPVQQIKWRESVITEM